MEATVMPLYKCHKGVRAAKIVLITEHTRVSPTLLTGATLKLDNGAAVEVDRAWLNRNPALAVGGYYVEYQQDDKYTSYSPAAPFEQGYSLAPASFLDRMKEEYKQLDERLEKLCAFADGELFKTLSSVTQQLLTAQGTFMYGYREMLEERIKLSEEGMGTCSAGA